MKDLRWYDTTGEWRRGWHLRFWWPSRFSRWWMKDCISWIWRNDLCKPIYFSTRTMLGGTCYCTCGNTTDVFVRAFGFGFHLWLHRDRGPRPCLCNLALFQAMPESYAEEIEDVGGTEGVGRLAERWERWLRKAGKLEVAPKLALSLGYAVERRDRGAR